MIPTKNEAKAVYDAMCALNNVDGTIRVNFGTEEASYVGAFERDDGVIRVVNVETYSVAESEEYDDQDAFASAYGVE